MGCAYSEERPATQKETNSYASIAPKIQIGNDCGHKWSSDNLKSDDHVQLVHKDSGDHFWFLERADQDLLWSFHVMMGEEKLFLTYNDHEPTDKSVKMASIDSSREKFFKAFLTQPNGQILFTSRSSEKMYLGIQEGALAMIKAEEVTREIKWTLATDLSKPHKPSPAYIHDASVLNLKWLSQDPRIGDRICVGESSASQPWNIEFNEETITIQPTKEPSYFATQTVDPDPGIEFAGSNLNNDLRNYKQRPGVLPHTFYIQNDSTQMYVGVGYERRVNGKIPLEMKKEKREANQWEFPPHGFILHDELENPYFYPPDKSMDQFILSM